MSLALISIIGAVYLHCICPARSTSSLFTNLHSVVPIGRVTASQCATFVAFAATRDRLQHLPREQRQQAAADMALRIAGLLSLEDGDGDEDP